jgi:hypothetical protein
MHGQVDVSDSEKIRKASRWHDGRDVRADFHSGTLYDISRTHKPDRYKLKLDLAAVRDSPLPEDCADWEVLATTADGDHHGETVTKSKPRRGNLYVYFPQDIPRLWTP